MKSNHFTRPLAVAALLVAFLVAAHSTPALALGGPSCTCNYVGPDGDWMSVFISVAQASLAQCQAKCMSGWAVGSNQDTCQETQIGTVCGGSSSISNLAVESCQEHSYVSCTPGH